MLNNHLLALEIVIQVSVGNGLCWVYHELALSDLASHYFFVISCIGAGDYSGGDRFDFDQLNSSMETECWI